MTACIVGWAHSRFGKLEGETLESADRRGGATRRSSMPASAPRMSTRSCSATSTPAFPPQDFTASLVLQADDRLRFKPATRVENACATGSAAVRQGIRAIDARRARVSCWWSAPSR